MGKHFTPPILRAAMLVLLALFTTLTVWADDVNYYDPTAAAGEQMKSVSNPTAITDETQELSAGWYYVSGNVENDYRLKVDGEVNLILVDGCTFTVPQGIHLTEGNTLNIYAQSAGEGCGKMKPGSSVFAGITAIGGNNGLDSDESSYDGENGEDAGILTIYGGEIEAGLNIGGGAGGDAYSESDDWGDDSYYSNGGNGGNGGTITIYGGILNTGDYHIGGGSGGFGAFDGSVGDATINLCWTNLTDRIQSYRYYGTVTFLKGFIDEYENVYSVGECEDDIDGLLLSPTVVALKQCAPTCTEPGIMMDCWYNYETKKYYADEALTSEISKASFQIPELGHDLSFVDAKVATFTTPGNVKYSHCSRCNKYFAGEDYQLETGNPNITVQGNATDGYYVLMPQAGEGELTIDGSVTSFKIYDNGGEGGSFTENDQEGNYSDKCDGYLLLKAPEGKTLQLSGGLFTEDELDVLTVYQGTTTDAPVILEQSGFDQDWDDVEGEYCDCPVNIGTVMGSVMLLSFKSDLTENIAGLDLTLKLVDAQKSNITIQAVAGGTLEGPATAVAGDIVTLTATPADGYLLSGVTVVDADEQPVEVTGGQWYSNQTATFVMPSSSVTVTPAFTNDKDHLFINMPTTGTIIATIPDGITSFKIYDDGGEGGSNTGEDEEGNYSAECDGYLWLKAPANHFIKLEGEVMVESFCDYLKVYDKYESEILYIQGGVDDDNNDIPVNIDTPVKSQIMKLCFSSDDSQCYAGLDLTATIHVGIFDGVGDVISSDDELEMPTFEYARDLNAPEEDGYLPDATVDGVDVTVYTLCLPYAPATGDAIKYYTLSGSDGTSLQFTEIEGDPVADKPYLVTVAGEEPFPVGKDTELTDLLLKKRIADPEVDGFQFFGTTLGLTNEEAAAAGAYILQDWNMWKPVSTNNEDAYIPPFRAYVVPTGGSAPLRIGTEFGGNNATGIQSLQLIDKDGTEQWFDLSGRRIKQPTTKGVYIHNGKKVAIQ